LIVIGVGGAVVSFMLMLGVFWFILSPGEEATAGQQQQQARMQTMPDRTPPAAGEQGDLASRRVPGGDVLAFADVLGAQIPTNPTVNGYEWATWGMTLQAVLDRLGQQGVRDTVVFRPEDNPEFVSVTSLNPDPQRYKVEYRFYNDELFHIEVFYSDRFENNSFNSFLLSKMSDYGKPFEVSVRVNELGQVILYAKWDTEESLIELVGKPGGRFSLFLDRQITLYQLEAERKQEERINL
jgi:hypothetical protein